MKKKPPKHHKRLLRGRKNGRRFRYAAAAVIIALLYVVLTDNVEMPVMSQQTVLTSNQASNMEVHFIDVGQGDCTLVKCGDNAMLIDTGDDTQGTTVQNYLQKQGITKLDYLILTHPDADHIGAAPVIITKFQINTVFVSNYEKDNKTYRKLIQALDDKRLSYSTPKVGDSYALGDAQFTILAPNKTYDSPNNASIALLLQNGDNKFLFSGDAEEEAESDILNNGLSVSADVYQVGHHGSRTSSSQAFLNKVKPTYAVISCAEGNDYGHPHAPTLNTLRSMDIKVFRTDEQGSIIAYSDGKKITWNCAPSETWKAGEAAER
ncbi:MAG: MBL fold metallo-hydrolase [Clostridium sp.]|nr:MBL fold metallo-hydrolase [Clostridium sp.]